LEKRGLLKGQGTITDAEFEVLQDAASTLSTDLSDEEFGIELQKTIDALSGALEGRVLAKQGISAGEEWDGMRARLQAGGKLPATPPVLGADATQMQSIPPVLDEKKNEVLETPDPYKHNKY
jgi:hypothetical protein